MGENIDYMIFVEGFAYIFLGVMSWVWGWRNDRRLAWGWLAAFGFLSGFGEWMNLVLPLVDPSWVLKWLGAVLKFASYLSLFVFVANSLRALGCRLSRVWILAIPAGFSASYWAFDNVTLWVSTSSDIFLGFAAHSMAAWVFFLEGRMHKGRRRLLFSVMALVFAIGGMAGMFFENVYYEKLVSGMDEFVWSDAAQEVSDLISTVCMLVAAHVVVMAKRDVADLSVLRKWLLPLATIFILAAVWPMSRWSESMESSRLRSRLLSQTAAVAKTINPDLVKPLAFDAGDEGKPAFRRLSEYFRKYAKAAGIRSLYSVALRDGKYVFGPESLQKGDPWASPPGTVYKETPEELKEAFSRGMPTVFGPFKDEYGVSVTAFFPLLDQKRENVLMMVGIDIEGDEWTRLVNMHACMPYYCGMALSVLLLLSGAFLQFRRRHPDRWRRWVYRHSEILVILFVGMGITISIMLAVYHMESKSRDSVFAILSQEETGGIVSGLVSFRSKLKGLRRYVEGSGKNLSQEKFEWFSKDILERYAGSNSGWAPLVRVSEKKAFEEASGRTLRRGFLVRNLDEGLVAEDKTCLPVYCTYPFSGTISGVNLLSEKNRRNALKNALETGLWSSAPRVESLIDPKRRNFIVYVPTTKNGELGDSCFICDYKKEDVTGVAWLALDMDEILRASSMESLKTGNTLVNMRLYYLDDEGNSRHVGNFPQGEAAPPCDIQWRVRIFVQGAGVHVWKLLHAGGQGLEPVLQHLPDIYALGGGRRRGRHNPFRDCLCGCGEQSEREP